MLLVAGPPAQDPGQERACLRDYEPFREVYLADRNESSAARQSLLTRVNALIRRYGTQRSRCAALLFDHKMLLLTLEERAAEAVSFADSVLALGPLPNSAELRVRMMQNQSFCQYLLGEDALSTRTLLEAAAEADGLPARVAVRLMIDVVSEAQAAGDLGAADRYTAVGERIARDSLAGDSTLYGTLGNLYVTRALYDLSQLDATRDTVERVELAEALLQRADDAIAMYDTGRRHITVDDRNPYVFVHALKAVALAGLGRDRESREMMQVTRTRLPEAIAPFVAPLVDDLEGVAYRLAGDWEASMATALRAIARAEAEGDQHTQAESWYQVGYAADQLGRDARAVDAYQRSIMWFEESRSETSLQNWNATAYAAAQKPYKALTRLLVRLERPAEAFGILEQSRVRHLLGVRTTLEAQAVLEPDAQARVDSLRERRAQLRIERQNVLTDLPETAAVDAEIVQINMALADLTGRPTDREVPSPDTIQRTLAPTGRVLIAPVLDEADGIAFVITADTLVAVRLPIGVAGLRAELDRLGGPWRANGAADPAIALAPLHRLYQALVAPVAAWLPEGAPLVVIPDDVLVGLPFEMLLEQPADAFDGAAYLVQSRPIGTELAATLLVDPGTPRTDEPRYDLVAFGRSDYGPRSSPLQKGDGPLADLPHVADEIRRVGAHARHGVTRLNRDATEARLEAIIGDARIVHLAAHAAPDPTYPLYSRVYLWGTDAGEDGALHMYELLDRPLRADLVVLSGCSTARGPAVAGEGLLGLQHAVRAAGARSSLATLWPVEDRAMVELMRTFYDGLAQGLRKDEALREAQLSYLATHGGLEASPFYWAALVLSGDVASVPLQPPAPPLWPIGAAVVAAISLGLAWQFATRRRRA